MRITPMVTNSLFVKMVYCGQRRCFDFGWSFRCDFRGRFYSFAVTSDPFIVLTANLMAIYAQCSSCLLALHLNCITWFRHHLIVHWRENVVAWCMPIWISLSFIVIVLAITALYVIISDKSHRIFTYNIIHRKPFNIRNWLFLILAIPIFAFYTIFESLITNESWRKFNSNKSDKPKGAIISRKCRNVLL